MVGFAGLFALVLGTVVIVTNMALTPRWITTGWGYMFAAVGIVLLMYHAVSDTEQEVRRMYGLFSALLLVIGLIAAIAPGPMFGSATTKTWGYNLLPWGVGFGFLSLIFAIPFARQETDKTYRSYAELGMLGVGAALAVGSLVVGVFKPDFLVGPGIALALLGLGFLAAYMGQVDTSEGIGYQVAFALGALGAAVALYALAQATVPTLLYEGPNVLRKATGELDPWRVAARLLAVLVFGSVVWAGWSLKGSPMWLRSTMIAVGAAGVIILAIASFKGNIKPTPPDPFLVPYGIILMGLGLIYLAMALGICSDNQFITLTRRELAAYFLSPIGYLVLAGTTLMQWISYAVFVSQILRAGAAQPPAALTEPIVADYFFALFPVLALLLQVPALTMGLIAEEKRTGTMEVLLTIPVNEVPIIFSKFLATWIFFMICWLPAGLFLIALRVEVGQPFDYRPLLSFYIAFAAQGFAFLAIGQFFSSLTRNQLVAAVLTFVAMLLFLLCYFLRNMSSFPIPAFLQTVVTRLSFISMWGEALEGRLPLRDTVLFVSIGVFFQYLSVKVLEMRKWI
jgi:ABC-type transport system involved in multi-copper enzyme maturation permease subunit